MNTMTNEQFNSWIVIAHNGRTSAAARQLGLDRDAVQAMRTGKTRNGNTKSVPANVAMAISYLGMTESNVQNSSFGEGNHLFEVYTNGKWRPLNLEGWFGNQTDMILRVAEESGSAAAMIVAAVMGYPIRIRSEPQRYFHIHDRGGWLW